jgi:catechol 2,3-dioxygenase-like lactoylglutathione lyase family enzyme
MRLGNFCVSLAVKDLAASREFYEKLGFHVVGGNGRNFSILQNETSILIATYKVSAVGAQ